jgi:Spy/CpxP family protein refolding chaperone
MRRKFVIIALVALLAVGTVSVALSYGRGGRGGWGGPGMGRGTGIADRGKAGLDLTKEQLEKLQSLRAEFDKETLSLRNELELKALELRQLWTADELDEEAIIAKSKEVSDLRSQIEEKMVRHRLDVAKVLTKEQRARFAARGFRGHKLGEYGSGSDFGMGRGRGRGHGFGPPRRGW